MTRTSRAFGRVAGQAVDLIEIASPNGQRAAITPFGARLVELWVPDRNGDLADIILGHDHAEDYLTYPTYFGATCGRYANRIAAGRFVLNGVPYQLDRNENANHLHGGHAGFDKKIWRLAEQSATHLVMRSDTPHGEMGYPGACVLQVTYRFAGERLTIDMTASTDAPTVINMVNHAYFNLAGHGSGTVLDHEMKIEAGYYTPVTADLLTTGEILSVADTGFDFRNATTLRAMMAKDPDLTLGYDHNWCLSGREDAPCVTLRDPGSGRRLRLWTNQPGVQIYTCGQMATEVPGKAGAAYHRFAGLTLETQKFPCSPNHTHFPSAVLQPWESYDHHMEFAFDAV